MAIIMMIVIILYRQSMLKTKQQNDLWWCMYVAVLLYVEVIDGVIKIQTKASKQHTQVIDKLLPFSWVHLYLMYFQ